MYIEFKFYKLKILGKLIIQYIIRVWFDGKSWIRVTSLLFTFLFPHLHI